MKKPRRRSRVETETADSFRFTVDASNHLATLEDREVLDKNGTRTSRYITGAVKRSVVSDGGSVIRRSASGRKCGSRTVGVCSQDPTEGGETSAKNLVLHCRAYKQAQQ